MRGTSVRSLYAEAWHHYLTTPLRKWFNPASGHWVAVLSDGAWGWSENEHGPFTGIVPRRPAPGQTATPPTPAAGSPAAKEEKE